MKNKKANLDIVIFTIMVLIICIYALVQISSYNKKFEFKLKGYDQLEEIQLEKKDLEYRLEKYLEECTIISYYHITKNKEFYEEESEYAEFFSKIKENATEKLKERVTNCLKLRTDNEYKYFLDRNEYPGLKTMLEILKNGYFELKINNQEVYLELKNQIEIKKEGIEKKENLISGIKLKKIGFLPFEEINKTVGCKKNIICIENITKNLFNVQFEEKEEIKNSKKIKYTEYNFTSKKEYYLFDKFEKISFALKVLDKTPENNP